MEQPIDETFRLHDANARVMFGVCVVMSKRQLVTHIDRSDMTLSTTNTPIDDQVRITHSRTRSVFLAPVAVAAATFLNALGPPPQRRCAVVTPEAATRRG